MENGFIIMDMYLSTAKFDILFANSLHRTSASIIKDIHFNTYFGTFDEYLP